MGEVQRRICEAFQVGGGRALLERKLSRE